MNERQRLVELVAENMAIYAGVLDETPFIPQAEELIQRFEAIEGYTPIDYQEIESWSMYVKRPDQ